MGRNPFPGSLELRLSLARPAAVELAIYDALGRQVHSRRVGTLGAGAHRILWDGRDDRGRDAGTGVFWALIKAGGETLQRKVVRLR
jgi:flagellar hook assembly protein FlgD